MTARNICAAVGILALGTVAAHAAPFASHGKDNIQVETTLDGAGSSERETNLGNLVADAVRQTGKADVALVAADEIGDASVPAGSVPASKIVQTLRYADDSSDTVVVLNITGAQLLHAVERGVSRAPQPFNGFLQVSGLQVHFDAQAPEGKRVGLVGVGGGEVSASKNYRVATTRALADGGLGYFQVWDHNDIAAKTGVSVADSLTAYLSNHKTVNSVVEGRISSGH